jgi:hypothetical protein
MNDASRYPLLGDLEESAAAVVGKIVFAFSRFELNLGLCLRCAVEGSNLDLLNPLVDRLSFKSKLDALLEIIELSHGDNPECVSDFRQWHRSIDAIRVKRNSFVHGRWGFNQQTSEVINVAPGMPGPELNREMRFSLDDLNTELKEIERVVRTFDLLRSRWSI